MPFCQILSEISKTLVLISAAFPPLIEDSKKDEVVLKKISYIHYPLRFWQDKKSKMRDLINFNSEVNSIIPAYVSKLGFRVCQTNVGAQKIDNCIFETFEMVLTSF